MNQKTEGILKADPFKWAAWEFQHDKGYWQERATNGSGLIQQIATFVMKHGQEAQG